MKWFRWWWLLLLIPIIAGLTRLHLDAERTGQAGDFIVAKIAMSKRRQWRRIGRMGHWNDPQGAGGTLESAIFGQLAR